MDQVSIKYDNIFHFKTLQNLPKFWFLVWKLTIWQTCLYCFIDHWHRGELVEVTQLGRCQCDQIGRFFASWAVIYFGQYFEMLFQGCLFHGKSYVLIWAQKTGWATLWAIFFTNSSGHPGCYERAHRSVQAKRLPSNEALGPFQFVHRPTMYFWKQTGGSCIYVGSIEIGVVYIN
jgi:hypothetical protein